MNENNNKGVNLIKIVLMMILIKKIIRDNKNFNYSEENDDIILNSNKNNINNKIEDEYYKNNNDINDKINNGNIIDTIILNNKMNTFDNIDNNKRINEISNVNNIINEKNEKKDVNDKKEIDDNNNADIKGNEDGFNDNLELIIKDNQRIEYFEPKIDRKEQSNSIVESKSVENDKYRIK